VCLGTHAQVQPAIRLFGSDVAAALHRSPAAFLVDTDAAAAIVEQIASNQER
jgi:hypothetical protein